MITCHAREGSAHKMETMLTEFRSLLASSDVLSFYSFQRSWVQRPQLFRPPVDPPVLHLSAGISSVSDTYIRSVLHEWYFSGTETYALTMLASRSSPSAYSQLELSLAFVPGTSCNGLSSIAPLILQ